MPKYKHDKIQKNKIQIAKIQKYQNKNAIKYEWANIQIDKKKFQNTNTTKYKRTKYKRKKIQMQQNTNESKYK